MPINVPSNLGVNAPEVKSLYESNPDTNAFTDAAKTQLENTASAEDVSSISSDLENVKLLALAGL